MITLNGGTLTNPLIGWTLLREGTSRGADLSVTRSPLNVPNSHGSVTSRGYFGASTMKLVIGVSHAQAARDLQAAFSSPRLIFGRDGWSADVELVSFTNGAPLSVGPDPAFEITIMLSCPGVWLRGPVETFDINSGTDTTTRIFTGQSGIITDAQYLFSGSGVQGVQLIDWATGIAWRMKASLDGHMRFDSSSGNLYRVGNNDSWGGGDLMAPNTHILPPNIGNNFALTPSSESYKSFGFLRTAGSRPFSLRVRGRNAGRL